MRKREKLEKECLCCGKQIPNRNKFCDNKCQNEYRRKLIYEDIEKDNGSYHHETYKRFLISKYGEKCMECGWSEKHPNTNIVPIQLEHRDGNSENNNLDNLKLLCPNCHSLTPTFGALNKGNGRKNRYKK